MGQGGKEVPTSPFTERRWRGEGAEGCEARRLALAEPDEASGEFSQRRPQLNSLYDVFVNVRNDEREHWKTLCNLVSRLKIPCTNLDLFLISGDDDG